MKQIIYTCDVCGRRLYDEPKVIFTFPVYWGYQKDENLQQVNFDKILTREYMLCSLCQRAVAKKLLDLDLISN